MANSFIDIEITFKRKGKDIEKKEFTESEFFDELDDGEEFDIDSCQRHLDLFDYIGASIIDVEWIELKLINLSTGQMLEQTHRFWHGNSLIISKWLNGADVQERELLFNLVKDGEQRNLKISDIEGDIELISDVIVTENEELIDMLP